MARKSRQNEQIQRIKNYKSVKPESVLPVNHTALYARLSLYDMNHVCRDSIQNQISMLEEYMENHPELNLVERYIDNGWSGTNFQRPGFLRMIQDIQSGKINCIVTKDLSRLGRNYLETGYYLEILFPMMGVRYISINDRFDSDTSDPAQLPIILKNILNDFFSRDLSRRFSDSYDLRKAQGVFRKGFPYGYTFDPEKPRYLTFDPNVSHFVRLIFQWGMEGVSTHTISMRLREMKAPTQERVEFLRSGGKTKHEGSTLWSTTSVRLILTNRVYTGDFVCGKCYNRKCDPYNKRTRIPEEEWVIIPNAHPAYISHEDFDKLQKRFEQTTKHYKNAVKQNAAIYQNQPNFYKRILFCQVCGHKIQMTGADAEHPADSVMGYACQSAGSSVLDPHPQNHISKKLLDVIVLAQLQNQFRVAARFKHWMLSSEGKNQISAYLASLQSVLDQTHQQSCILAENRADAFESHADFQIDDETFGLQLEQLRSQSRILSSELAQQANTLIKVKQALSLSNPWLILFTQTPAPHKLDSSTVHQLIERIELNYSEQVTIHFKEESWFLLLCNLYDTLMGGE